MTRSPGCRPRWARSPWTTSCCTKRSTSWNQEMSRTYSISSRRPFGMSRVCRIWGAPRATIYRYLGPSAGAGTANAPRPPRRRGPKGACSCRAAAPHPGGDRRLAFLWRGVSQGLGPAAGARCADSGTAGAAGHEGKRSPRAAAPYSAGRPSAQRDHRHRQSRRCVGDRYDPDGDHAGRPSYVFIAVDHCSGEFIGTHASSSASRWEALEPVRQGVTRHFGGVGPDVARGLTLRHAMGQTTWRTTQRDHPSSNPAPEGNGVAERAIRTLKEQLLWVRRDRRGAAAGAGRLRSRAQRFMAPSAPRVTPDQIRAEQKALEPEAATGVKMAA